MGEGLPLFECFLFFGLECTGTAQHLVEVNLVPVEFGTVDTHEASFSANADTAGTTHARSVNHYGVQAHVGGNVVLLSEQAAELHHDGRADGKHLVDFLALNYLLDADGHDTFLSVGTIVGHDDDLVARLAYFVFQYDKIFGTSGQNRDDSIASSLQCLYDGQHGCNANAATSTNYGAKVLDVCGTTQRTNHVGYVVAFVQGTEFRRRSTHGLDDKCDGAGLGVASCNS